MFIFNTLGKNNPNWPSCFGGVEATNQECLMGWLMGNDGTHDVEIMILDYVRLWDMLNVNHVWPTCVTNMCNPSMWWCQSCLVTQVWHCWLCHGVATFGEGQWECPHHRWYWWCSLVIRCSLRWKKSQVFRMKIIEINGASLGHGIFHGEIAQNLHPGPLYLYLNALRDLPLGRAHGCGVMGAITS